MIVPIFDAYLMNSRQFLKFNFAHFTGQVKLFFLKKGNLKFSDSKIICDRERNQLQKNPHFLNTLNCI